MTRRHIRMGPPGPGETPMPDRSLKYLILGCFRAVVGFDEFPIKVDHVEENRSDSGTIQSFTIVTESGLRFTTTVEFEEVNDGGSSGWGYT